MSSDFSDDDMPLARTNGNLSAAKVSKADDRAMDKGSASKGLPAPVSIRNGPVAGDAMDVDSPSMNGNGKRKSRGSLNHSVSYKDESDSDDAPIAKRPRKKVDSDSDDDVPLNNRKGRLPPKATSADLLDDDSDDKPLTVRLAQKKKAIENAAARDAKLKRKVVKDESDSDAPLAAPKGKKRPSNGVAKTNGVKKQIDSDSDAPLQKAKPKPKTTAAVKAKSGKTEKPTPVKKAAVPTKKVAKKDESEEPAEDEEDEEKWWAAPQNQNGDIKWNTLEHNGVLFPPAYEPLPKNVKLVYDGKPVDLHLEAEEVAGFFGSMLNSTHNVENPVFQKNFFGDFKDILKRTGGAKDRQGNQVDIKDFAKLDFRAIFEYYQAKAEARKSLSKAEKDKLKEEKKELEEPFIHALWNGKKEKVGNFRVEPPSLFRGRGEHPRTGKVKLRVEPEQITINIGKEAKVPEPPKGHKWKAVQHDQKATWLAMWQENINGNYKYVMMNSDSMIKGQSDWKKFEKARALKGFIDKIRKDYTKELKSDIMAERQRATAMYLIDKLALRAGNEKDTENEAETVGCCSLKYQHITLKEPDVVVFDFLGKDSIRYYDEVKVERQVFKNLKLFKKPPKAEGDDLFDRLNTSQLNKHLSSYMTGLTAKVFRTYNASYTMSKLLKDIKFDANATVADKLFKYNLANREVAILCNHKRTVTASHEASMEKMGDRIKAIKFQMWRTKMMLLDVDPKQKKKKGAEYFQLDEELDNEEWIQEHITFLVEEQRTKITKKFENDNKKRTANGEKPFPEKELKERLKAADDLGKQLKKERKTKKVEAEGKSPSVDKIEEKIQRLDKSLNAMQNKAGEKDANKEVALGTSKINYIDPRLSVVFCKKFGVPIEKVFPKTLQAKFQWAIEGTEEDWEF